LGIFINNAVKIHLGQALKLAEGFFPIFLSSHVDSDTEKMNVHPVLQLFINVHSSYIDNSFNFTATGTGLLLLL